MKMYLHVYACMHVISKALKFLKVSEEPLLQGDRAAEADEGCGPRISAVAQDRLGREGQRAEGGFDFRLLPFVRCCFQLIERLRRRNA